MSWSLIVAIAMVIASIAAVLSLGRRPYPRKGPVFRVFQCGCNGDPRCRLCRGEGSYRRHVG